MPGKVGSRPTEGLKDGAQELEREFQEFGEVATAFVKRVSSRGAVSYRGDMGSVRVNVGVTKKVFSKWSVEIILSIYSLESAGFGDLKRLLSSIPPNGISSQVLSKKLRELEGLGFLDKEVVKSNPPKVRYTLSAKGELLAKIGEPVILYLRRSVG